MPINTSFAAHQRPTHLEFAHGLVRDTLYADIAREVALLEQQGNLLKKVVKLVTPSVVHIESTFLKPLRLGQRTPETDEEAGSGTIVEIGGLLLVGEGIGLDGFE